MTFLTMSHQEMDRLEIVTKVVGSELVAAEAAEQLGLSVRQVKRLKKRFREDGATSLIHRGRGQPSKRKLKPAFVNKIITTIKKFYPDFGPTLACEKLFKKHQIKVSKETVRKIMTANNLWKTKPNKRNHQHRAWRPRKNTMVHWNNMMVVTITGSKTVPASTAYSCPLTTRPEKSLRLVLKTTRGSYQPFGSGNGILNTMVNQPLSTWTNLALTRLTIHLRRTTTI